MDILILNDTTEPLEAAYWLSQIVLLAFVVVSVLFAQRNLKLIARQHHNNFLLNIDERWESQEIREARRLFTRREKELTDVSEVDFQNGIGKSAKRNYQEHFKSYLQSLRNSSTLDDTVCYQQLFSLVSLFETLGYILVTTKSHREKVFLLREIGQLFGIAIEDIYCAFEQHILQRQAEISLKTPNQPADFYANFIDLAQLNRSAREQEFALRKKGRFRRIFYRTKYRNM